MLLLPAADSKCSANKASDSIVHSVDIACNAKVPALHTLVTADACRHWLLNALSVTPTWLQKGCCMSLFAGHHVILW